jgi:radical SAM superfamily enzyme YgiQ (UPF0313 family)
MGKNKILLITGFAPMRQVQIEDMGITNEPIMLASLSGQTEFRLSIPTIAPAVIGSYLQQRGIEVEIKDYFADKFDSSDADIVGISSTFMSEKNVKEIADFVRSRNLSTTIVLGGPISWSISPSKLLESIPNVDYIIQREGEQTFYELIQAIRKGSDVSSVNGLFYRRDGSSVGTSPRALLDEKLLVQPAWELMDIPSPKRLPVLPVETSRGCPYNCSYCSEVHYWGKPVRYHSSEAVAQQIKRNAEVFGITTFRFTDSCFSAPPARCGEVCDAIYEKCIKNDIQVKWSSYARINNLDYKLLGKMKRSGCVALDIGVESGASSMLDKMNRSYTTDTVLNAARAAKELGIIINFNLVIGFPGETEETIRRTAELINNAAPDTYSCFQFFLAPNSTAYQNKTSYGLEGEGLIWKHATMTSEEAAKAMQAITKMVTNAISFPGGEYCACYLSSLGYSPDEIRGLFRAIKQLSSNPTDENSLAVFKKVMVSAMKYV